MKTKVYQAHDWVEEFPGAVTVCDMDGIILEMNERAKATFSKDGPLIGKNLQDCHHPAANQKIDALLASGEKNIYTIEKNGIHKLIYQVPWYQGGKRMGLVEASLEIPEKMPHFKRG